MKEITARDIRKALTALIPIEEQRAAYGYYIPSDSIMFNDKRKCLFGNRNFPMERCRRIKMFGIFLNIMDRDRLERFLNENYSNYQFRVDIRNGCIGRYAGSTVVHIAPR